MMAIYLGFNGFIHQGKMTHICVSALGHHGLSYIRRLAIAWIKLSFHSPRCLWRRIVTACYKEALQMSLKNIRSLHKRSSLWLRKLRLSPHCSTPVYIFDTFTWAIGRSLIAFTGMVGLTGRGRSTQLNSTQLKGVYFYKYTLLISTT